MRPRILLTGGTGFVGRALLEKLSPNYEVWALAGRGPAPGVAAGRLLRVDLARADAADEIASALPVEPFEAVFHLAARTPRMGGDSLEQLLAVNTLGTQRLLAGLRARPRRFAHFSTVDVYGHSFVDRVLTEDSGVSPATNYAISKYAAERVVCSWSAAREVPAAIFRLSQVYGPADPTPKAIPTFCAAAAAGQSPVVKGSGEDVRQPVHVEDVVGAATAWLEQPPRPGCETLLVAGGEQISIRDLARLVMEVAGLPGSPQVIPAPKTAAPTYQRFDLSRAMRESNWAPAITLREGIRGLLRLAGAGGAPAL